MGVRFFRKNLLDLDASGVVITATDTSATSDGQGTVDYLRNRDNTSGYITTESADAYNTQLVADMGDAQEFNTIILPVHNMAAYTIQGWNGSSYVDFSTAVNVSGNTKTWAIHEFDTVVYPKIKLICTGTIVANEDKAITQLIVTYALGEFACQPTADLMVSQNRIVSKYPSGRAQVTRSIKTTSLYLKKNNVINGGDLALQELIDDQDELLVSPCGFDDSTSTFPTQREGWRPQDIYLMSRQNEHRSTWEMGRFKNGIPIDLNLIEVA